MTLKLNRVLAVVKLHVRAKYDQSECRGSRVNILPYVAVVKNPKMRFCNLNLWPMTLEFNTVLRVRAYVKVHVSAKFHQAQYSGLW